MKNYYCYVPKRENRELLYNLITKNGWPVWKANFKKDDVLSPYFPVFNYSQINGGFMVSTGDTFWSNLITPVKISFDKLVDIVSGPYGEPKKVVKQNLSVGDTIWYREKGDKSPHLIKRFVQEVKEGIVALNDGLWSNHPSWVDLNRIEIVRAEKRGDNL